MNELIPIDQTETPEGVVKTVNARDLHEFLEVGKDFSTWIKDRINKYGFTEHQDYVCSPVLVSKGRGGHNALDYHLSLDMAKELSMVERNDKGRQARQYFIECEKVALNISRRLHDPQDGISIDLMIAEAATRMLRLNDGSKIAMLSQIAKNNGRPSNFLPAYTEEKPTKSLTVLLKEHNAPFGAQKANQALINLGLVEINSRPSTKGNGVKEFKSLTAEGLKYGKNLISPNNQRETQCHFFEDTFEELLGLIQQPPVRRALNF